MSAHPTRARTTCARIAVCCLVVFSSSRLYSQDVVVVETAPAFEPPNLQPSLLDFLTGQPIAEKMKLLATPKLLRPPFAGAPINTPKGLAAKIKAQQVDAPNRVAAVEFLGTVDCIAYPESQAMLVEALKSDPAEPVRLAAAEALQVQFMRGKEEDPSRSELRRYDTCRGCCNEATLNELSRIAYETDETGCPIEPSERVRKAARIALTICSANCYPAMAAPAVPPSPIPEEAGPPMVPAEEAPLGEARNAVPAPRITAVQRELQRLYAQDGRTPPPSVFSLQAANSPAQLQEAAPAEPARLSGAVQAQPAESELSEVQKALRALFSRDGREPPAGLIPASNSDLKRSTEISDAAKADVKKIIQVNKEQTSANGEFPVLECLRGFCVVGIKERKLLKGREDFVSVYNGHTYQFASAEAKQTFDSNPEAYEPVQSGVDLVTLKRTGNRTTGPYVCHYEGRLYFFESDANRKEFRREPAAYLETLAGSTK